MIMLAEELMTWKQWGIFGLWFILMAVCVFSVMRAFQRYRARRQKLDDAIFRIDAALKTKKL